ncbi:ATP-binding protein [Desulfuromonas sp.]|uniref:sensor histidine kinase n=1 Tax=Desulfuromonas sp. TaxID=892 RepID=UPI0025BB228C|nr:ATP-binding protein [Desulfuromonas sp.]
MDEGQSIHLLVVEDSPTHLALIREALESRGGDWRMSVAGTLAEARALLSRDKPDLALIDMNLPDGLGTELLPADPEGFDFGVVVLTGEGDEQTAVEVIKAGALDYVVKSAGAIGDLPHTVERALREWRSLQKGREAEERLRRANEFSRTVLDSMSDALSIIDVETFRILGVNRVFLEEYGLSEGEVLGKTCYAVTHALNEPCAAPDHHCPLRETVAEGDYARAEHVHLDKEGRRRHVEVSTAPIRGPSGKVKQVLHISKDITPQKLAEEKLRAANRELEAFVYTVSHDLRSPLTPIIGYAEYLEGDRGESLDEEARELLREIQNQGHRMLTLIEDLLNLARIGHMEIPPEPVSPEAVLEEVLREFGAKGEETGVVVSLAQLPLLHVPRSLLAQVFRNLVGNALRYAGTGGGGIEVGGEDRGDTVLIHVRDHGPGLPPSEREKVFEVFRRGAGQERVPGTGVGLATVRKIAQSYGGSAWVEETPGGGCTFLVELNAGPDPSGPVEG